MSFLNRSENQNENWSAVKSMVHRRWSEISDDEIEATHGDKDAVIDLLAGKYQIEHDEAVSRYETALAEEKQKFQAVEEIRKSEIRFETDGGRVVPGFDDSYEYQSSEDDDSNEIRH
ncbi:hypothetical protein [Bdellovibrio sp. HCB209]|uniref:hypothetical protein n=1 Tax=Bdellovibrio sp. HCB209 TaxID=3394354 RepID=UPI0039B65E6B